MNEKDFYIILDNLSDNVYSSTNITVPNWGDISIENILGFYDDFKYSYLLKKEFVDTIPNTALKLYFNICYFPELAPYIWIDEDTKKRINEDRNSFLWVYTPHEAKIKPDFFEKMEASGVKLEKIIFSSHNEEVNNKISKGVKFVSLTDWWEAHYRYHVKTFSNVSFISPKERWDSIDNAEKKMLSLNRNIKGHRVWWYKSLLDTQLLQDSHVSYYVYEMAKKENYTSKQFKEWVTTECKRLKRKDIESIINDPRIFQSRTLDDLEFRVINHQESIVPYYKDSLFSVVTESLDDQVFLTEKTFKAIMHCHPFILVGQSEMNEKLKSNGYKTYETLFGITSIENIDDARKFVAKFGKIPSDNLKYIIKDKYKDIIEHNWYHFLNRKISFNTIKKQILRITS